MALTFPDPHDPTATLDYTVDWSKWVSAGDRIVATAWAVTAGDVVVEEMSCTDAASRAVISGGTAGTIAELTCHVTTESGLQDTRRVRLRIRDL